MYYTVDMNGWLKQVIPRFFGFLLALVLASCGSGVTPPATPEADSTPTSRPSAPDRVVDASPPEICNCILRFDRISIEQGLSQSSVQNIFQDAAASMVRHGGWTQPLRRIYFKTYKPDPDVPSSLSDRWITSIVEDQNGYLWIGTRQGGLNRFDPHSEQFLHFLHSPSNPLSLSNNHVNTLLVDKDNNLWAGTPDGLDLYDRASSTFSHYIYKPAHNQTASVERTSQPFIRINLGVIGSAHQPAG
jgi:hypothetical protein